MQTASVSNQSKSLVVLTSVSAERREGGLYRLPQKFIQGMQTYARAWDGPVCAMLDPRSPDTGNLDHVEVAPGDLGFSIRVARFGSPELYAALAGQGVLLATVDHRLPRLAEECHRRGLPCVYNAEYTLRTRLQFLRAERTIGPRLLWGGLWELRQEAAALEQFELAAGIQCNGLPCFLEYARRNRAPLLYFDSRIRSVDLATDDELLEGNRRRRRGEPLHLVFSGRLIRAKGADYLPDVALALRAEGVPFRMTICGDGELRSALAERIERARLEPDVRLAGVLEFTSALLPLLKSCADVFVCCHRQGDPSCTYLETFACGVPIVGYANEALSTFIAETDAGATVPMNSPRALASLIAGLHAEREPLCAWARRARDFAARHTQERAFASRIRHLERARELGPSLRTFRAEALSA
jgi:colanic acid/amylovoran biosynthesis glycosyltransferase